MILFIIINVVIVAADIITKNIALTSFSGNDVELIKNVLYFSYVENRGAAFGILSNARYIFISVTVITIIGIIIYLIKRKPGFLPLVAGLAMVSGGGIGNLIDRLGKEYVIDFIDFRLIGFPVFNVADIFVTVGAVLIFISVLFFEDKIK